MKAIIFVLALLCTPSSAAIVTMDISDQAGFTTAGGSGVFGNGTVFVSPKYFFDPGTTVDFGMATVFGDYADYRSCGANGAMFCPAALGTFVPFFLVNGEGGPRPGLGELAHSECFVPVGSFFCTPSIFHLLLTLGPDNDGVQLAFQGYSLSIVPAPLPAALPMFAAGLGLIWYVRRHTIFKREAEAASQASMERSSQAGLHQRRR